MVYRFFDFQRVLRFRNLNISISVFYTSEHGKSDKTVTE